MHKISIPIHFNVINDSTLQVFIDMAKNCGAARVFLCTAEPIYSENSIFNKNFESLKRYVKAFKDSSLETGIWISGFGHGVALNCDRDRTTDYPFTRMEGVGGESYGYAYCPTDKSFTEAYSESVKKVAHLEPDIIMLDDDFRINCRRYYFGCFCPNHMKMYEKILGEKVDRSSVEKLIFSGGKNKYRSAYMKMMSETLLSFAKKMREAVDSVDASIRLGACTSDEMWDFNGTDSIEVAKAFAGNTKPFTRSCCAPYWNKDRISRAIDVTRAQGFWCKNSGVEIFAEGDTYPRPRYMCASNLLEMFDLALIADGSLDGDLKYMTDYNQTPDYETGYTERHIRNTEHRKAVAEMFQDKTNVGIRVAYSMHVVENAVFPDNPPSGIAGYAMNMTTSQVQRILSDNAIPTTFEDTGYPIFISGENARYVTEADLKNGAILDIKAAHILSERGIDTGVVSSLESEFECEQFCRHDDAVYDISRNDVSRSVNSGLYKVTAVENAEILSRFLPDSTPSAYKYVNKDGLKFYVLAYDAHAFDGENFLCSYYRQEQLIESCKWLCGKELPAVCKKNPFLYMLVSEKDGKRAVALFNIFRDDMISPVIKLDKSFKEISFINCNGTLDNDTVTLSDIQPYGFAAFEVK